MIARQCLRIDPARRCTIDQINSRLQPPSTHPVTLEQVDKETIARRRLGVSLGAAAVLLVTIAIWAAYEFHHEPSSPTADEQSASVASPVPAATPQATTPAASTETQTEVASASPNSPAATQPPPASQPAAVPSSAPAAVPAATPVQSLSAAPIEAPTSPIAQSEPSPAATPSSGEATVKGQVSHQVQPDVLASAMRTISGTVKVAVRVSVDSAGHVTNADVDSAGPSKYFANKALEAARQFAFQPADVAGQAVGSAWILHFDFKQSGVAVSAEETTP